MKFATEQELKNYVNSELSKALPSNWKVNYQLSWHGFYLEWVIVPPDEEVQIRGGHSGFMNDYLLQVTQDYSTFIITHGNNTAGPYWVGQAINNAKVINSTILYQFSLSEIISHIIDNYIPNTWGFT
ncbi:MAG: hypothetical protein AAF757_00310 [Cyanobacteria bacterium P01_D01_bin.116]